MTIDRVLLSDNLSSLCGHLLPDVELTSLTDYVLELLDPDQSNMRIDWDKLPAAVRNDLRDAHEGDQQDAEELETACRKEVSEMAPKDVIKAFLEYNGIINYTGTILMAVDGIRAAAVKR